MDYTSDFWTEIKKEKLPIVLYGTGDGADRVLDEFERRHIPVLGVFASDGFVRDRSFRGFKVLSYSDARRIFGKMAVILCFGSHREDVIENILRISSENELYMPDMLRDEAGHLFDLEYASEHKSDIEWAYSLLEDDISRRSFKSIIDFRLSGKVECLIPDWEDISSSWSLLDIRSDESFVDCGAYTGDTISRFLSLAHSYEKIYAFEPDVKTMKKLEKNTEGMENVTLYNAFVSDKSGEVLFMQGKGRGSNGVKGKGIYVPSLTVDSALSGKRVSIIKYDTEGFELEALEGSRETIKRYSPRLILSSYHKIDDLWVLPRKVLSISDNYNFLFRKTIAFPYWDSCYYIYPKNAISR